MDSLSAGLPSACDRSTEERQLCRLADPELQLRRLSRRWVSPDPLLAHLGVRYLQIGGDWWNRCSEGWLNIDSAFMAEGLRNYQIGTDDKGSHNMVVIFDAQTVLPFRSQSVQLIYSEHMLEHMLPDKGGANWIREMVRLLVPGGVLRLATPDLSKYMCSYARPRGPAGFLQMHARRFAPQNPPGLAGAPSGRATAPSDATIVNNIFRNYGHQWVYDFGEVVRLAHDAGVDASALCRSRLDRHGMPRQLDRAVRRATSAIVNASKACWLDQQVRDDESLYVHVTKQGRWPNRTGASWMAPFCRPNKGWSPCSVTMPPWHPNVMYPGGRPRTWSEVHATNG